MYQAWGLKKKKKEKNSFALFHFNTKKQNPINTNVILHVYI